MLKFEQTFQNERIDTLGCHEERPKAIQIFFISHDSSPPVKFWAIYSLPCLFSAPFVKKKNPFCITTPHLFFFFFLLRLSIYCIMNCRRRSSWTLNLWNLLILAEWSRGEVEKIVDWTLPHLEKTFLQQLNHPHFKEIKYLLFLKSKIFWNILQKVRPSSHT